MQAPPHFTAISATSTCRHALTVLALTAACSALSCSRAEEAGPLGVPATAPPRPSSSLDTAEEAREQGERQDAAPHSTDSTSEPPPPSAAGGSPSDETDDEEVGEVESTLGSVDAPCEGRTCFGHGQCVVTAGKAACVCDPGYHAAGLSCLPGAVDPKTRFVPAGYELVFSDEFSGGALDTSKWSTRAPWNVQWFEDSHQLQAFVPEAVTLGLGVANLTAARSRGNTAGQPYSSGSLTTKRTFTRGYFETRVKVPAGKGFWPAFWLTSSTRWPPEWDIFEIVRGVNHGFVHPAAGGKATFMGGPAGADGTYLVDNQYDTNHVYGFKWTSSELIWYVDGVLTQRYAVNDASGVNDAFWLNLSLQVGGDWPGAPDATTPFPSAMVIDYVRVYQPR